MKTSYRIEIIKFKDNIGLWYKDKTGDQFDAVLRCKSFNSANMIGNIAFKIDDRRWVNPDHCKVIGETKN